MAFIILTAALCCLSLQQQPKKILFRRTSDPRCVAASYFSKDREDSECCRTVGDETYLKAGSNASASGLVLKREFAVRRLSYLRWKWKVDNVYSKGNPLERSGDDYPIRVYVIFRFDPDQAGFFDKVKYGIAKKLYGEYPPHSSLNYVWASRDAGTKMYANPYTDRAMMIVLQQGAAHAGQWISEEVNMLEDYRKAFGSEPPAAASIAIMNDSDNTGEQSVSYVGFLEVFGR
jgi:hypothetical protein